MLTSPIDVAERPESTASRVRAGLRLSCIVLLLASMLAACEGNGLQLPGSKPTPQAERTATSGKPAAGGTRKGPGAAPLASDDAVKGAVIYPDGRACRAVSDGGLVSNLHILGQVSIALGTDILQRAPQLTDTALQARLDEARPGLRELSKRMLWLPQASEEIVGQQMLRMSGYKPYTPNGRERRFIEQTLQPIFDRLAGFAKGELESNLEFRMRFFSVPSVSAEMVPGGTLIIPQRLLSLLMGMPDRAESERYNVAAFIMAHEFSHALRRHLTKSTQMRLVDGMTMGSVFKANFKGVSTGFDAASSLTQMFDLSQRGISIAMDAMCKGEKWFTEFDVTQESEADVCGALLLDKLEKSDPKQKVSPVQGLRGYNTLVASIKPSPPRPGICVQQASHPDVPEREANLKGYESFLERSK